MLVDSCMIGEIPWDKTKKKSKKHDFYFYSENRG